MGETAIRFPMMAVGILPALVMLAYFRSRENFATDGASLWPLFGLGAVLVFAAVALGVGTTILVADVEGPLAAAAAKAFLVAAVPEEAVKLLAIATVALRGPVRRPHEYLVLAVAASTGFAALENVFYTFGSADAWAAVALVRSLTAVPGHAFSGAVMGACIAVAMRGRRLFWPLAYLVPAALHGLYDIPVMFLEFHEKQGLSIAPATAHAALAGFAAILLAEAALAHIASRRLLAASPPDGLPIWREGPSRMLLWWRERRKLQAVTWSGLGLLLLLTVPLLALGGIYMPDLPKRALASTWLGILAALAVLHGGAFLALARSLVRAKTAPS